MGIYRGSFGEISNKADWVSPVFQFIDADTDDAINLSTASEIYFEIKDPNTRQVLVVATLANGKITLVDVDRFQVALVSSDLSSLSEGQYLANLSYTMNSIKADPVIATITILEGAG